MEHEGVIRLTVFLGLFTVLAMAEAYAPRRARRQKHMARWLTHWGMTLLNTATLRPMALVPPLLCSGAAANAATQGWDVITPDMRRAVHRSEQDSNCGFSLSIWDRLFGKNIAHPAQWQDPRPSKLLWSLALPFQRK